MMNDNRIENESIESNYDLIQLTEDMLDEARATIDNSDTLSVPVAELATLGAGVASILPTLNTVTQSVSIGGGGLFKVINMGAGDALKATKGGDYWGAFKTAEGKSKMAKLQEAGPISAKTQTVAPINPATMMMAVALFSIEQELGQIAEMEKQILSFLRIEKEAEIEAQVETLMDIITKYKYSWDNEKFVTSNLVQVLKIKNNARKNMLFYQKEVEEMLHEKKFIVAKNMVESTFEEIMKKFQYYRLSLYTFSMASMLEILLGENFKEEFIAKNKDDITAMTSKYRILFEKCSLYLEKMGDSAVEANVVKGLGIAGKAVGSFIGSIPLIKEGPVDEFLQKTGDTLQRDAEGMETKAVKEFAPIGNPETTVFVEKLEDVIKIYNHTSQIYLDNERIYLITDPE